MGEAFNSISDCQLVEDEAPSPNPGGALIEVRIRAERRGVWKTIVEVLPTGV